jgi:hypothetical protein
MAVRQRPHFPFSCNYGSGEDAYEAVVRDVDEETAATAVWLSGLKLKRFRMGLELKGFVVVVQEACLSAMHMPSLSDCKIENNLPDGAFTITQ